MFYIHRHVEVDFDSWRQFWQDVGFSVTCLQYAVGMKKFTKYKLSSKRALLKKALTNLIDFQIHKKNEKDFIVFISFLFINIYIGKELLLENY